MMKKYLLSLLIAAGMLLITCGEEPAEEFYEGTPEDSTAIFDLLADYPELLETIDGFIETYTAVAMDNIVWGVNDSFYKGDSEIVKQLVDSSALALSDSSRFTDLWFTKDTTCTVYLRDTFTVTAQFHYSELQTGYFFYAPGDTTTVLDTVIVDQTPGDTSKTITGEGERLIFFEPIRDPEVDMETGDTIWVIREPMEWVLKRISYGRYYYPDRGQELPGITTVVLQVGDEDPDTIYSSSSVDTFPGHAMNRLRSIDSLLTYNAGDTLEIDVAIGAPLDGDSVSVFASCDGDTRMELADGSGEIVLSGSGIVNLYIEVIHNEGYYYITPDKGYLARVWLIPINLGGTQ
jgi:hypothetical protein